MCGIHRRSRSTTRHRTPRTRWRCRRTRLRDTTTSSPGPTLDEISSALAKLAQHTNVSEASPEVAAGQPAYTVSVSPKANGGLFGDAQLTWAAANGVPLRLAITAKGDSSPVLELKVTDISFGSVASSDVAIPPPAGAKIVDLGAPAAGSGSGPKETPVTGLDAVRAAVTFPLTAPASVGDLSLSSARLVGKGALLTYGDGLGALVVHESATSAGALPSPLGALPKVSLGAVSARELQTPLGTVLQFRQRRRFVRRRRLDDKYGRGGRSQGLRVTDAPPVAARGLVKRYGDLVAVDHVDLTVERGDVFGYLGPNGAGKTTSLRMLLGLIRPTEGSAQLFGRDPCSWARGRSMGSPVSSRDRRSTRT